jgi:hypothetical protein
MTPYCELDDVLDITTEDVTFLRELADKYDANKVCFNHKTATGDTISEFDSYQHFYIRKDTESDYRDRPIFQKLADACADIDNRSTLEDIYQAAQFAYVGGYLPFHKDPRSCALSIPLNDIVHPLDWQKDDGTWITNYKYQKGRPVLINTRVDHGCESNNEMRNFFHISFNEDYAIILDKLKNGK